MARVLIIEDEESLRDTLASFLGRVGHDVIAAADGREAFERGLAAQPQVVVADWMLQNHVHGLQVSETFRAVDPDVQTVLITGFPSEDLMTESNRSGVFELLEKPFGLEDLRQAVTRASQAERAPARVRPIAVAMVDTAGTIEFASARARDLFRETPAGREVRRLDELFETPGASWLQQALGQWIPMSLRSAPERRWLVRSRQSGDRSRYLIVLCPEEDPASTHDPRVRILVDHWRRGTTGAADPRPVVVIESDGAVRRLLASQISRVGSICYSSDDLETALRLLRAEPRAATVLVDFAVAGDRIGEWVQAIREARVEARVIGMGGAGTEQEILAQGVDQVLAKPWRMSDLLDAIAVGDAADRAGSLPS